MTPRVLSKFESLYLKRGLDTTVVPLNFVSILARDPRKHSLYGGLRRTMESSEAVHLHVLSGACHLVCNLFHLHPELKPRVVSQLYDSPCHINGAAPALREFYGVPAALTRSLTATLFPDCLTTSERFMRAPVVPGIPTGVVFSARDSISPLDAIEQMLSQWEGAVKLSLMQTNSKHLLHMRDETERYESLVDEVLRIREVDALPVAQAT
eukprot:CAMPEP_0119085676 /NCGR_PEP_ID=MMETSP1178-20130426/134768_1 /TAXON_ID=33656 /ORGANISM="unid sp, Strain CCMP2000" /LENGTH=209 /DNA_ID=CAMNT_0007068757 /DNA_START=42 /DNA_END=671 /DNA_ORIENTATION=-